MSATTIITGRMCQRAMSAANQNGPALLIILDIASDHELDWAFQEIGGVAARILSEILMQRVDQG